MRLLSAVLGLALHAAPQETASRPASAPTVLDLGAMRLEVHLSRTAQLFHVLDQLSEWDPFCHRQYARAFRDAKEAMSLEELAALAAHRSVRAEHGWGEGLEQTFYSVLDLDAALAEAKAVGRLDAKEAETERDACRALAARVDRLIAQEQPRLEAFRARVIESRAALDEFAAKVSRFCKGARVAVPVFLIANPAERDFGGGFNGGRLTLEVPHAADVMPTFLHELMHAFVATQEQGLRAALLREPTLDYQTLNEGIAHALAPGIYRPSADVDQLRAEVLADVRRGARLEEPVVRFRRFGLALRPILREALESKDQTIDSFLPRALDAWRVLKELDAAAARPARVEKPQGATQQWFAAGPGWELLTELARARGHEVASYNHSKEHYESILQRAAPGSRLVLLLTRDHADRRLVPGYEDLLPRPRELIDAMLARGETVELSGKARGLEIVTLAAPTLEGLERLIRTSKALE